MIAQIFHIVKKTAQEHISTVSLKVVEYGSYVHKFFLSNYIVYWIRIKVRIAANFKIKQLYVNNEQNLNLKKGLKL